MPPLGSALAILRRAKFADLPLQMIQRPYGQFLESSVARQPGATFDVPERTAHPVLIARSLLQIALSLQLLSNTGSARSLQSAKGASHRYFEAATQYVTSQDLLLGSYDGLETLMLEGLYQINEGNLRQGWLAFRRAIGIAQVMKVPIQSQKEEEEDDESEPDPSINQVLTKSQFLWFRLNYSDRFLSLMLGLPFAAADDSFVSSRVMAADVPVGRLERMHTIIMGRLISRNQRISAAHHLTQALQSELEETDSIDQELQRVLRQFPGHWWLSPHLCDLTTGAIDSLEETSRLLAQVNQANLLLLLHLPYAIQGFSSSPQLDYAYNIHNTIKASRDVLSRFVLYRKFNQVPSCCRAVDSKALTASASLVLAHLDGHRLGRANVLMHQRLEDLGLVQMAIKSIEGLVALSPRSQGEIEARVLKGLLDIEARAADGVLHTIHIDEWGSGGECYVFEEGETLDFRAPYFGRVRIEPLEVRPNPRAAAPAGPLDRQFGIATSTSSSEEIEAWPPLQSVAPGNAVASLAGLFPGMGPLTGEVDIHVPETTWVSAASFTATELTEGGFPYLADGAGCMSAPGLGGIWLDD
ncbi:Fungal-trans domain-containing protein [Fusarium falciforme]|uniref:Fungal-trans domain-containing protein n=1 Tax=Fusarium falciforme TaxID=195108 RepID=UPI002301198C|nr:Fungal-trans domain-containing protein [Fusarium falciforme]WAO84794.1 Fungal-trans domain-containing protein [Fusarium falciforme]